MGDDNWHNKRRAFLKTAAVAGTVGLAGCSGGGSGTDTATESEGGDSGDSGTTTSTQSRAGGTLNVAQVSSPVELDPINNNGGNYSIMIKSKVYSSLFDFDANTNITPLLATEIPELTNDGTEFTINIDDRARFHNGDKVTAEDVKYSFLQPVRESTSWASNFSIIDSIEIEDETTAHFTLERPYKPILYAMEHPIAPKSVREQDREAFGTETIVGSGPFQVADFREGEVTALTGWDDYWGNSSPYLDEVNITPINESTTRITQLQTGNQDIIRSVPPKLFNTVEQQQESRMVTGPGLSYQFAAFNQNEGECAKRDVRLAIDHCVDLDSAVEKFVQPAGERLYSPLPTAVAEAWDMPVDEWQNSWSEKDIDRAQELFEQAGVPNDWECKILVSSTDFRRQMAVSIANGIKEAGYNASVQYIDFSQMLEVYNSGDASRLNMYLLGWTRAPEPDRFLYELLYIDGAFQGQYYTDERFNELLEMAHTETDRETRREMYIEAINIFIEDRVHLPLYTTKIAMGANNRVQDFEAVPISTKNPYLFGERLGTNADVDGTNVWVDS
jgi:peptide/nickel transport system substrate-binding protein